MKAEVDGTEVIVGNSQWMIEEGCIINDHVREMQHSAQTLGRTGWPSHPQGASAIRANEIHPPHPVAMLVGMGINIIGMVCVSDRIREESALVVGTVRADGMAWYGDDGI